MVAPPTDVNKGRLLYSIILYAQWIRSHYNTGWLQFVKFKTLMQKHILIHLKLQV